MARFEIDDAKAEPSTEVAAPVAASQLPVWQRPVFAVVAMLVGAVVSGVVVWNLTRSPREVSSPPTQLTVSLPATDRFADQGVALSPDGRELVYVATRDGMAQLFRRSMGQLLHAPIPGTEGASRPFFSPDGVSVGFFADDALKTVPLVGGVPR